MTIVLGLGMLCAFMFSVGCCCACAAPCLHCDEEEIEALGVNVTVAGLAPTAPFFCNCDDFNGTWHLPFNGHLDDGRRCEFAAEFDFNYCGEDGTLAFHVTVGCEGDRQHSIDVLIEFNETLIANAIVLTDGKLDCDFSGIDMGSIGWNILCAATNATITLAAA